jgi:hypothetical protein
MAWLRRSKTSFSFFDSQLKYNIIYGPSYPEVLNRYNAMAGPSIMPPTWAFGSIWWRDDHHDDLRRATNAQEKVIELVTHNSRPMQQPRLARHVALSTPQSSLATIPFKIISFAAPPHLLTLIESHLYRKQGRGGGLGLTLPLFSYSYASSCTVQNAILNSFLTLRTLCAKHPGVGYRSMP